MKFSQCMSNKYFILNFENNCINVSITDINNKTIRAVIRFPTWDVS